MSKEQIDKVLALDEDPEEPYGMLKKYLGHALIVNNVADQMPGSAEDVKALKEAYEQVGFAVTVFEDQNQSQMKDILSGMKNDENHKDSNCFMLTIMTHGDRHGRLVGADGLPAWQIENLVESLNGVKKLINKPKLLVIYACRGDTASKGQVASALAPPKLKVADKADFYIAYGTVPGYVSAGAGPAGSFYLQLLAKNLKKHYNDFSIDRIFTCIKHEMEDVEQNVMFDDGDIVKNAKQCPEERNSLRRILMFSQFKKRKGTKEDLKWIPGQKVLGADTESPADQKEEIQQQQTGSQPGGTSGKGDDAVDSEKPPVPARDTEPPSANTKLTTPKKHGKELTDKHVLKISQAITKEDYFNALAVELDQENKEKNLTNNPRDISNAAYNMLNEWKRSVATRCDQFDLLYAALVEVGLSEIANRILLDEK